MPTRDGVAGSAYHKHGEPISRLAFLEALQLFASAFDSSGGFRRLIQIVFGLSIAFAASSFFLSFFSFGGGVVI